MEAYMGSTSVPQTVTSVKCPTCGANMRFLQGNKGYFYGCPNFKAEDDASFCEDSIPADENGLPISLEERDKLRKWRNAAHTSFDRLWKGEELDHSLAHNGHREQRRLMSRREAYKWLRKQLRLTREECHIGNFGPDDCEKVIELCHDFMIKAQKGVYKIKAHDSLNRGFSRRG